jgi:hypothetical protein
MRATLVPSSTNRTVRRSNVAEDVDDPQRRQNLLQRVWGSAQCDRGRLHAPYLCVRDPKYYAGEEYLAHISHRVVSKSSYA